MGKNTNLQWLIVGGCPRSGTTMLKRLLNTHPGIALFHEKGLLKHLTTASKHGNRMLTDLQRECMEELHDKHPEHLSVIGDKAPQYYKESSFIPANVKVIHISRHPEHTINSMMNRTRRARKGKDPRWNPHLSVKDGCILWAAAWNHISNQASSNILHLKYEDIIAQPQKETAKIAFFLQLDDNFNHEVVKARNPPVSLTEQHRSYIRQWFSDVIDSWHYPLQQITQLYPNMWVPPTHAIQHNMKTALWRVQKKWQPIKP